MATQTITASEVTPLRASFVAPNYCRSRVTILPASSLSASDVIFLMKVPNGATVYDWALTGPGNQAQWKVGMRTADGVVDSISGLSITNSSMYGYPGVTKNPIPFHISLSDGATPQWAWCQAVVNGSTTGTVSLIFSMMYLMGESTNG